MVIGFLVIGNRFYKKSNMDSKYHFRFEDLQIYQKAMDFGELVNVLAKKFPQR